MKYKYFEGEEDDSVAINPRSNHHYNRPRCTRGEVSLGESKVSVGGYVDSLDLIGQLLAAGENLQALRVAMSGMAYDYDSYDDAMKDEDIILPVSRQKGFDLVDWSNLKRDIDGKIVLYNRLQEEEKVQAETKAKKKVSEPQETVQETVKVTSPDENQATS